MDGSPKFADPPVVELVLGAQFSPLTKLSAGDYGRFWNELGDEWTDPADLPLLDDQFELFDRPRWRSSTGFKLQVEPVRFPGRFMLGHRDKDRLLQVQPTRFHLNWRKREGFYPSYGNLIAEFEGMFSRFADFVKRKNLGELAVNQWEITYIDAFPREEYWQTPADWSAFLPGLFGGLFPTDGLGISLENRAAEWSYEIEPNRGRLHIAARPGRFGEDKQDALLLTTTARGPVGGGGAGTLREGLDCGHEAALGAFLRAASDEAKNRWESKP